MAHAAHDHGDHAHGETGAEYAIGTMEIGEQRSTYQFFMGLTKWGSLTLAVLLVFLVLLTSTGAGILGAIAGAAVLLVAGIFMLRGGKGEAH